MKKLVFLAIFTSTFCGQLFAQFNRMPFEVQDSLLVDLNALFQKPEAESPDTVVAAFESIYTSLDAQQQTHVYNILSNLYAKRMALKPHFVRFFESLDNAKNYRNMQGSDLTRFLEVTDTTASFYNRKVVANFLKQSHSFLSTDTVYHSKFNSMVLTSGSFSFEHNPDREAMGGDLYASTEESLEEEGVLLGEEEEEEEEKEEWFDDELMDEELEEESDDWSSDDGWSTADDADSGWGSEEDSWSDSEDSWGSEEDSWSEEDTSAIMDEGLSLTESELYTIPEPVLPEVVGPYIALKDANFAMLSIYDTFNLEGINASLMLKNDTIVAESGKVTWKNVGYPEDEVYAELGQFSFDFHNPEFKAEKASLTYNTVSGEPIIGELEYKSHIHNTKPERAKYPKFRSYHANVVIEDFVEDITYKGGVALEGKKFKSQSVFQGGKSMIRYDGGENKFTARSKRGFTYEDSLLYSPQTEFTIHYSEEDSISHPAVYLKYHTNDKLLQARKDKDAYKIAQFIDTRNDVNITADFLEWSVEADSFDLEILNARERIPLVVESKDYFDRYRFIALKGNYNFHPLQMVVGYSNKIKKILSTIMIWLLL